MAMVGDEGAVLVPDVRRCPPPPPKSMAEKVTRSPGPALLGDLEWRSRLGSRSGLQDCIFDLRKK